MSESTRYFKEITARDRAENGVVSLAIRPNMPSQYGEGSLSGKQPQQRFDRLAGLIIERYNTMASALSSNEILEYFKLPDEYSFSTLLQLIERISDTSGNLITEDPESGKVQPIKDILKDIYILLSAVAAFVAIDEQEKGKTIQDIYATIQNITDHNVDADNNAHPKIRELIETSVTTHNESKKAHSDIRKAVSEGDSAQSKALSDHDSSELAHSKLRANITKEIEDDISVHNISDEAHDDIRGDIKLVSEALTALEGVVNEFLTGAEDNDGTLDRLREIVAYIENNKELIEILKDDKIDKAEIVTTLDVDDSKKVLAASVGKIILEMFNDYVKHTDIEDIINADYVSESELEARLETYLPSDLRSTLREVFTINGSVGLEYQFEDEGGVCMGIGDCPYNNIAISSVVNGIPIRFIQYRAFADSLVTDVEVLSDDHTTFLGETFKGCTKLITVIIHSEVVNFISADFSGCIALESIHLPKNTTVFESCFEGCSSLKDVYYAGAVSEWQSLSIESVGNEYLINATIHCSDGTINGTGG